MASSLLKSHICAGSALSLGVGSKSGAGRRAQQLSSPQREEFSWMVSKGRAQPSIRGVQEQERPTMHNRPALYSFTYLKPPSPEELLRVSERYPGHKVERSGSTITVTICDGRSDELFAELSRQLGNWALVKKTHAVGGSSAGFSINPGVDGDAMSDDDKTFSPDAWLLEKAYRESVFKSPLYYGCKGALVCEVLSPSDYNAPMKDGTQTIAKAVFDKADIWMKNGAAYLLLVDPINRNFLTYDKSTWSQGERAEPLPPGIKVISPCPELFPGLQIDLASLRELAY